MRRSLGDRVRLRLFSWALISVSASNVLVIALSAAGLRFSTGLGLLVHSGLTIFFLLPAIYFACIDPLIAELHDGIHKIKTLEQAKAEVENRLAEHVGQLTETKRKLDAEEAGHRSANQELERFGRELEQRVLERTAKFESLNRALQVDLGEQSKVAEVLRESEKRYRRLVEIATQGIWTINAQGQTNFVNARASELLGYSIPELLGRPPSDFVVTEDLPKELQGFDLQRATPPESLDFRMRHKDGRERWMRAAVTPVSGDRGDYLGALILFSDVTPHKRSEQRQQDQAVLLDSAQDAILVCDPNLHLLTWTVAATRLYGWEASDVLGRSAFEVIGAPSSALVKDNVIGQLKRELRWRGDLNQVTKGGRSLIVDARFDLVAPAPGKLGTVLAVFTDVTQKRMDEAQALRGQRRESAGAVACGLAQELNNALAPILLSAQMLRSKTLNGGDRDSLAAIESSAQRSVELLRQALIFARGTEGDRTLLQPAHLIKEIADIIREMFPRTIQVVSELQAGCRSIKGDHDQLHQILLKLCVHARDAMTLGGTLYLRLKEVELTASSPRVRADFKPGFYVQIEIQHTGSAIPVEALDRVFEPYFGAKGHSTGTGLGLAMVFGIVQSHGGTIEVQSLPAGGARFEILLPAAGETALEPARQGQEAPSGRGELILMVDDEVALLDAAGRTLRGHGYEVLAASDGGEALDLLARHQGRVRVVFTNIVTPSMDGPALARAARRIDPRVRIIASSGLGRSLGQAERIAALRTLGIIRLLAKPYSTEELLRAVSDELKATHSS